MIENSIAQVTEGRKSIVTLLAQKAMLHIALRLVVWCERRMLTQSGQMALDDARLEIQTCINTYFR